MGEAGRGKREEGETEAERGRQKAEGPGDGPAARSGAWRYIGVGCLTLVGGFFGGGMTAVLVAKFVGLAQHCTADAETGAPCDWFRFWVVGAVAGGILLPTIALVKLRRGSVSAGNPE
jgi:hypothetical protein